MSDVMLLATILGELIGMLQNHGILTDDEVEHFIDLIKEDSEEEREDA